jgi:ferredoxin
VYYKSIPNVKQSYFRRREMAKPVVDSSVCVGCGSCEAGCPAEAIKVNDDGVAVVDTDACVECLACIDNCPAGAITEGE